RSATMRSTWAFIRRRGAGAGVAPQQAMAAFGRAEVSAKAMRRDLGATRHHAPSCWQTAPGETLLAASSPVLADARPGKFGYGEANTRGRGPGQPRWPPPI